MSALSFGCQCVLLVVFAVSVVSKVRDRKSFHAFRVATAALLPTATAPVAGPAAFTVLAVELAAVVTLAVPGTARIGLFLSAGLLAVFSVAIAAALRRGSTAPCRCFGASTTPLSVRHLVRNGVLIALAVLPLLTGAQPGGDPVALAMAAGMAVVVALLVISFDVLVDLFAGHESPSVKGIRP